MLSILVHFVFFSLLFVVSFQINWLNIRNIVQLILLMICIICSAISAYKWYKSTSEEYNEVLDKYRNIYFEGEVISSYTKRNSSLLYIRIDSANIDYHYSYKRGTAALRIKDGIATLPIGMIDLNNVADSIKVNADYVIVNKNNSSMINYITGNDTLTLPLSFWPGKLNELDFSETIRPEDYL